MAGLISGLGTFFSLETLLRVTGHEPYRTIYHERPWSERHPIMGWVNKPGIYNSNQPGNAPMTFLKGGRRATRPAKGRDGKYPKKVFLVGGSYAQGYGMKDEESLGWLLNKRLPHVDLQNYGTGGYSTYQSILQAQYRLVLQENPPDVVIYGFAYFHHERNVLTFGWMQSLRSNHGERFAAPHVVVEDGKLAERGPFSVRNWPLEGMSAFVRFIHDKYLQFLFYGREKQMVPVTRELLKAMNDFASSRGIKFLVAILEDLGMEELFTDFMDKKGIGYVNCTFPDSWNPRNRLGGTGHPKPEVHAFWAKCIGDSIEPMLREGVAY